MRLAISENAADAITLVIAIAGLILGVASLVWQAATFVLAGARVKVTLKHGARGLGGALLGPVGGGMPLERLVQEGFTEPVLAIEVVNVGRLPTTVTGWRAVFENGMQYTVPDDPMNPDLPYRLEPQTNATWHVAMRALHATVAASHSAGVTAAARQSVRMSVDLANGKTIRTSESIVVSA